jgi:hypothetical protein
MSVTAPRRTRRRLGVTLAAAAVALTTVAPAAAATARPDTADDITCKYHTIEGGYMLTPNWSRGDWLPAGTIVTHTRGTVQGSYRAIHVVNTGAYGWWGGALAQVGSCWT